MGDEHMDRLIGMKVYSKKYGTGYILDCDGEYVAVQFSEGKKKYEMDAFSVGGLELDEADRTIVDEILKRNSSKNELTAEQDECVDFVAGDLLIRGVPGSGKSYVIMKRALKLHKTFPESSMMVFTYANSLVNYMCELYGEVQGGEDIQVSTVDSYCMKLYAAMTGRRCIVAKTSTRREFIEQSIAEYIQKTKKNNSIFDADIEFWEEEIAWIKGKCIMTCDDYVAADRTGRGAEIRVTRNIRPAIWDIMKRYDAKLQFSHQVDWEGIYVYISKNRVKIPKDFKMDYILLDEAQDMSVGKLRVLKSLAKVSITIAADVAQKIYKSTFTWKEAGIDISGRASKSLTKSFRSTRQIVSLAEDLIRINKEQSKYKGEYTEEILPEKNGPLPIFVATSSLLAEENILKKMISQMLQHNNSDVIGLIVRDYKARNHWHNIIKGQNLPCQLIKRGGDYRITEPGVIIVTAHSSKGLEFDVVVIPSFEAGVFPYKPWRLEDEQTEEFLERERSLVYVAMTRARRQLVITYQHDNASEFIQSFDSNKYKLIET